MPAWLLPAIAAGSAVLGGLGSKKASEAQATATKDAAVIQERIAADDRALQEEMWDYQRGEFEPWKQAGLGGLAGYEDLLYDPWSITSDPGYQFGLGEGLRGIEQSSLAGGMGFSGATLKGLTRFGQDYATNEFDRSLQRYATLADYGSGAVAGASRAGMNYAGNMAANYAALGPAMGQYAQNMGQINAAGAMAPYNALSTGLNTYMTLGAYQNMFNQPTAGTVGGDRSFLQPVGSGGVDIGF